MSQKKPGLDKDFFVKGAQSLNIKQLLQIPTEYRTHQHAKIIIHHVKDVKFLERYMDSDQIFDLAKEFQLKSYESNSIVFKQGETADAFYIILSGSVKVFITIPSEVKHFSNLKEVMKLEKGDAFGELALLYDSVRSATIVTDEPTELIMLNKESFRKHIRTISTTHLSQIMEYFKDFPAFQTLQMNEIAKYAARCILYRFPSNTVIIREGDKPHEIYFIKSGRVKVIRRVNFKIHPATKNLLPDDPNEPSLADIERGNCKSTLIEIDELSNGDSFCDFAVLNKENMTHSIVCSIPCELIALPVYDLSDLDEHLINEFKSVTKPYPDDNELRKMYLDLYRWNIWKNSLYKNIQIEKTNKRRGFNQQLRQPFLKKVTMEKLTIPVQTTLDYDLYDTPKAIKGMSSSKSNALIGMNFSQMNISRDRSHTQSQTQLKSITSPIEDTRKKSKFGSFPKIGKGSETALENTSSARDVKNISKHRKFEFVVPQHKLAKTDEKAADNTAENGSELLNWNDTSQMGSMNKGNSYENSDVRAPYPFDLDNIVVKEEGDGMNTPDEERGSVLGTREVAQTFDKVFNQMMTDGIKLPAIGR